jgi:cobalt-zinc-cadmium efflux system outer membrane protein
MRNDPRRLARILACLGALMPLAVMATDRTQPLTMHLSLVDALKRMRSHDPNLALAQTAVEQAAADTVTAGERPNATLAYSTSKINPAGNNGPGTLWDKSFDTIVSVNQPFERGGKRQHRLDQADANADAAHADYADTLRRERLAVAQAYWELKRAQEKQASAHALAAIEQRSLHATEARLKLGDIASIDAERLHIGAAQADNAADQANSALADARVALAALLDANAQADALIAIDDWPSDRFVAPDADQVLARRPDIAAAQQHVHAAQAALELAHAQRTRDITFSGQYEHDPAPFGHTLLGIGVSIPLFTGNHYEGEIRRANADLDAALVNLARARLTARSEVQRAIADTRGAHARVQRYNGDLVERARHVEQTAEAAYTRGGFSLADLLDARRELKAAQDDATDARADFAEATAALAAAAPTRDTTSP